MFTHEKDHSAVRDNRCITHSIEAHSPIANTTGKLRLGSSVAFEVLDTDVDLNLIRDHAEKSSKGEALSKEEYISGLNDQFHVVHQLIWWADFSIEFSDGLKLSSLVLI